MADTLARDQDSPAVGTVMSRHVVAVAPKTPLTVALQVMLANQVHHVPVVEDGRCVGLLHESDALWELCIHRENRVDAEGGSRRPASVVDLGAKVNEVAALMRSRATDAVVVTDAGRIAGIVTATDLVRAVANAQVV
jgi:CBS domain-containing protein